MIFFGYKAYRAIVVFNCVALGFWLGFHKPSGALLVPFLVAFASIPKVVLYPIIMGYAILRHQLFDMRVATAQGLMFLLWIFVGVRFAISTTVPDALINGILFLAVLVLGVVLVRSVKKEVQQREEIEKQVTEIRGLPFKKPVEYAVVTGTFHLERTAKGEAKKDDGIFSLVWRKGPQGWKILLDHTS